MQTVMALVDGAERIAVLTGAGVSAESGVPTFRGEDGLWKNHRAEELAHPETFSREPHLVWEFYNWRRSLLSKCKPNRAHHALAALEAHASSMLLMTQNVDGLHHMAGSHNVIEMHGNIWRVKCTRCTYLAEDYSELPELPKCPSCGDLLRPDVVWFGEQLEPGTLHSCVEAAAHADIFMTVGTSGIVQPAASLADLAKRHGAVTVEINLDPTPNSGLVDFSLQGKAADILDKLIP
ncbi:SIR2 family NAD-dependent protein deacylase [Salidesulfovibrio brasiliensis]|uniref:SIR2 family NAD-dependent protein deacylase n=1 Tax=Salidesulfovibrio brasiliensis TaxID=221711 RepID=UPI000A624C77|nr:NAD-dependent deacylase [Salidesulfovibrio brasiliensis]